jgi:hypothetical protein
MDSTRYRRKLSNESDSARPFASRWRGYTVVCIASGASITSDDIETVKTWRETKENQNKAVIVTNTSFKLALWADALFAQDKAWWDLYLTEVNRDFIGEKFTNNPFKKATQVAIQSFNNSGIGSIQLAIKGGARRVVLLGYDCQITNGKKHWHGDHPKGLSNATGVYKWVDKYNEFAKTVNIEILNASRQTALDCFKRIDLKAALNGEANGSYR